MAASNDWASHSASHIAARALQRQALLVLNGNHCSEIMKLADGHKFHACEPDEDPARTISASIEILPKYTRGYTAASCMDTVRYLYQ